MVHKVWSSIEEVSYCFSRSPVNCRILTRTERFRIVTRVRIHRWLWNYAQSLKQPRRGALFFFQGHLSYFKVTRDKKITDFDPNCGFPDCKSSLNSPMDLKWCTKLDVVLFFNVIYQISRSHGLKNRRFESNSSKIIRPVAAIKSLRFALFQKY